jgi:amino acid transporter
MPTSLHSHQPSRVTLLALGSGTSLACVCVLGIAIVRDTVPGLWSFAALALAFAICRVIAGTFAHLVRTVPSGAGMFAFIAKAWGSSAAIVVIGPYVILMILMGALEALIIGHLLRRWFPLPAELLAATFAIICSLMCMGGVRLGFRIQAAATALLVVGILMGSAWLLYRTPGGAFFWLRIPTSSPAASGFANATGQCVFLFMGFELICAQVESSAAERVSWALKTVVWLLALVYAIALLAANTVSLSDLTRRAIPRLISIDDFGRGREAAVALFIAAGLGMLASLTSLNGAFMGLSRLIALLGTQRVLPRSLGYIHPGSLTPRRAMTALLLAILLAIGIIARLDLFRPTMFAAAISAALFYALAILAAFRPPFLDPREQISRVGRVIAVLTVVGLFTIVAGVLVDAGTERVAVMSVIGTCYVTGLLSALRLRGRAGARLVSAASHRPESI